MAAAERACNAASAVAPVVLHGWCMVGEQACHGGRRLSAADGMIRGVGPEGVLHCCSRQLQALCSCPVSWWHLWFLAHVRRPAQRQSYPSRRYCSITGCVQAFDGSSCASGVTVRDG
jgi:hypothetical protein